MAHRSCRLFYGGKDGLSVAKQIKGDWELTWREIVTLEPFMEFHHIDLYEYCCEERPVVNQEHRRLLGLDFTVSVPGKECECGCQRTFAPKSIAHRFWSRRCQVKALRRKEKVE